MTAQIPISKISLYDRDFQLWIETTVNQLRQEDFASVDWTNLIEELGSIGKNNRQAFKSLLIQLLAHLLKLVYWQTEREYNANKWEAAIINFRVQIADLLEDSPSLKPYLLEIFDSCYGKARQIVSKLSKQEIPIEVIITPAETLAENWFP